MKEKSILLLLIISLTFLGSSKAQNYNGRYVVGLMGSSGSVIKFTLSIEINDSTVVTSVNGQVDIRKIKSRSGSYIYTGDDVVTDRIMINPIEGRLKGFSYNHALVLDFDSKYQTTPTVTYFAQKVN